ncbi:MAG: DUF2061 domain-containing protein [Flavobacteriales bacterium]
MFIDALLKRRTKTSEKVERTPLHSLLKTISWRIIGTIDTVVISYLLTGTLSVALSIGAVEVVSKMLLYFIHERVWERLLSSQNKKT